MARKRKGNRAGDQRQATATQAQGPPPGPAQGPPPGPAQGPPPAQAQGGHPQERRGTGGDELLPPRKKINRGSGDSNAEKGEPSVKNRTGPLFSIGHCHGLSARHAMQLSSLASLITSNKGEIKLTDDPNDVLHDKESSCGVYMQWCKQSDSIFIRISSAEMKTVIEMELLAVCKDELMEKEALVPLLAFSQEFDADDKWAATKLLLQEVFGSRDARVDDANYIYAFTRISQKIHIQTFKINIKKNGGHHGFDLVKRGPSFVLKPEKFSDSNGDRVFLDQHRFLMDKGTENVDLSFSAVIHNSSGLSHVPHHINELRLDIFLPTPPDTTEWEGYTMTAVEFFTRYHAYKRTHVPGTGPPPEAYNAKNPKEAITGVDVRMYNHLCRPFQMFGRSCIVCCEEAFAKQTCYENIELENLFFRGKKLKILGAKLVNYTVAKAEANLRQVAAVISDLLRKLGLRQGNFPHDLENCLDLLKGKNPLDKLEQSKNHVCWMDRLDKILMFEDIFDEFEKMTPAEKLEAGKNFPKFGHLQLMVARNWLMRDCSSYRLPTNREQLNELRKRKRKELSGLFLTDHDANADKLFTIQKCFKTPRNAFQHLTASAAKLLIGNLSREVVEFVVSSEFTKVYMRAQEGVTRVYANRIPQTTLDNERSKFSRFGRYFQAPEGIQFKDNDKK
ncbi:hypothetical protein EJB05_29754 [Eragrostis curvula]|uniref:Uncharacterized protein n=1 Tax=Eragrostis curvula TaxID=38414 RepID=A0A5J9UVM3_9POAL|nr:hypothetical protein EJB05_29754 [Eragrostis curvula]